MCEYVMMNLCKESIKNPLALHIIALYLCESESKMILSMSTLELTGMLGNKLLFVRGNPHVSTFFLTVQSIWESRNKGFFNS